MKRGGFAPSRREPCTVHNVERRLIDVNNILNHSEEYVTSQEQLNALNNIVDLIAPNEFGAGFVVMNTEALVTNNAFRELVMQTYMVTDTPIEETPIRIRRGGKSMKSKRKITPKKHRKSRRKYRKKHL